jgi:predicted NUDIX family NTP pyrophosphohydrolase
MGDDPLAAAIREVKEETGLEVNGDFFPLDPVRQKSGKIIYAFALEGDYDVDNITSNIFEMTWPPNSGTLKSFPEVDRAAWFNLEVAATKIVPGQVPLLQQLKEIKHFNKKNKPA